MQLEGYTISTPHLSWVIHGNSLGYKCYYIGGTKSMKKWQNWSQEFQFRKGSYHFTSSLSKLLFITVHGERCEEFEGWCNLINKVYNPSYKNFQFSHTRKWWGRGVSEIEFTNMRINERLARYFSWLPSKPKATEFRKQWRKSFTPFLHLFSKTRPELWT